MPYFCCKDSKRENQNQQNPQCTLQDPAHNPTLAARTFVEDTLLCGVKELGVHDALQEGLVLHHIVHIPKRLKHKQKSKIENRMTASILKQI